MRKTLCQNKYVLFLVKSTGVLGRMPVMSLGFLFGLALLDLLGDVPKALDELAVEIKAFDFRCERVGIVNVC